MKCSCFHKRILVGVLIAVFAATVLTACKPVDHVPASAAQPTALASSVYTTASYITATSLSELSGKSVLVVIGKVVRKGDIINMARDVDDISKPAPNLFAIGQVYEFEVTHFLKSEQDVGEVKEIHIVQVEGMMMLSSQNLPSKDDIEDARANEKYNPIHVGSEYVLFLEPLKGFTELEHYYTGVAHPWRFLLVNGCTLPDSPWNEAGNYFQAQPISDLIEQVINPTLDDQEFGVQTPYPPPGDGSPTTSCLPDSAQPIPYP